MPAVHEPQRVSAADFIRGFANWRLQSARKPVVVTHHGKDAHVLISLDDYRRLHRDADDVPATADNLQQSLAGLAEAMRDAVILIDRQWLIVAVNPAASDMLETSCADLIGTPLTTAVPRLAGSFLTQHIIRLIDHRERFSGEVPDILQPRKWLRIDMVPAPIGGALILRDVSDAMAAFAATDARQALLDAIEKDGGIGHARVSVRETVEVANDMLTGLLGVDPAAIKRVRFSALLAVGHRSAFAEALESVFRSGRSACLASQIVTRDGAAIDVALTIAEVRGPYASDGAIVLVTRRAPGRLVRPARWTRVAVWRNHWSEERCKSQLAVYVKVSVQYKGAIIRWEIRDGHGIQPRRSRLPAGSARLHRRKLPRRPARQAG